MQTQAWPPASRTHRTLRFMTFLLRTAHHRWSIATDIAFLTYKEYDKWWQLTFFCNVGTWPVCWTGAPSTAKTREVKKKVISSVNTQHSKAAQINSFNNLLHQTWFQGSVHDIQILVQMGTDKWFKQLAIFLGFQLINWDVYRNKLGELVDLTLYKGKRQLNPEKRKNSLRL